MDMFRATLKLPMETPDNLFVAPVTIEIIESFMNRIGYQGVVDKVSAFYTKFLAQLWQSMFKLIIADLIEKYPSIPQRHDEDYHSIKDDTPLVSVYSIGNVIFRGMQILYAFLTADICDTDDYKEYETVFVRVDVPMNQAQPVVSTQRMHRSTPRAHRTPTISTSTKVQEKLAEEEIEKMVEGEKDEELYESEFANSILNDNDDDSGTRIEPGSHKENPEVVDDDNVNKIEKKNDDRKDETMEKTDDAKEKDNDDHTDHSLIEPQETGSKEIRNEKTQTPIFTPIRSPRKDLSSDKTISEELTTTVSPTIATTSKDLSTPRRKKISISYKTKIPPGSIAGMCRRRAQICSHIKNKFITHEFFMKKIREVLDHYNNVVPEMTFAKPMR
ncbi:hypothetical protein Tco_0715358 [Tanacetum coccineum]